MSWWRIRIGSRCFYAMLEKKQNYRCQREAQSLGRVQALISATLDPRGVAGRKLTASGLDISQPCIATLYLITSVQLYLHFGT